MRHCRPSPGIWSIIQKETRRVLAGCYQFFFGPDSVVLCTEYFNRGTHVLGTFQAPPTCHQPSSTEAEPSLRARCRKFNCTLFIWQICKTSHTSIRLRVTPSTRLDGGSQVTTCAALGGWFHVGTRRVERIDAGQCARCPGPFECLVLVLFAAGCRHAGH